MTSKAHLVFFTLFTLFALLCFGLVRIAIAEQSLLGTFIIGFMGIFFVYMARDVWKIDREIRTAVKAAAKPVDPFRDYELPSLHDEFVKTLPKSIQADFLPKKHIVDRRQFVPVGFERNGLPRYMPDCECDDCAKLTQYAELRKTSHEWERRQRTVECEIERFGQGVIDCIEADPRYPN